MPHQTTSISPRCQARQQQILKAATTCFAGYGFHGASIAQIAKTANMSPGHIYHFFENKEAIIAALVEQKLQDMLETVLQIEGSTDIFQAMLERIDVGLHKKTDPEYAALELEILAEAARNPKVSAIVQEADKAMRMHLRRLMQAARLSRGQSGEVDDATVEIMATLFDGLAVRITCNPGIDRDKLRPDLEKAIQALF